MTRPQKQSNRTVYLRDEARSMLEKLCDMECRSLTDQMTVVLREAFKARGLDPDDYLRSLGDVADTAAA